jgi:predicted choloylglycine hydrolase
METLTKAKTADVHALLAAMPPLGVCDWREWRAFGERCAQWDWATQWDRANQWDRATRWDGRTHRDGATTRRAPATGDDPDPRPRHTAYRTVPLTIRSYTEARPGDRWKALFEETWAAYRGWYAAEGLDERPGLAECRDALERHMPELVPTWERLVELADRDETAARMLSLWRPPAFEAGCTQAVLPGVEPVLVRNYDYHPDLFEGVVASTDYSGGRRVIGTSDCLWGLVDGMNEDGLVVSLSFGGRPGGGEGFGIPLVVRCLLETCTTVEEACDRLDRLPVAQAYNLLLADTSGGHATVFVAPGEPPVAADLAVATNHRLREVEHELPARAVRSVERQECLLGLLDQDAGPGRLTDAFLADPVYNRAYSRGFGTLFTAVYQPALGAVTYHWPERRWERRFDSPDASVSVSLAEFQPAWP